MKRLIAQLREHRHIFIVVTLLTLVTTFPTIVYVFWTDVFWHPAGRHRDVYIKMWDVWYGNQFFTGQADRFYTDLMFYPEGLSLTFHPLFIPHIIVVNALNVLLPFSNAFSLAHLLSIVLCALSAYIYLHWLFQETSGSLCSAQLSSALAPTLSAIPFTQTLLLSPQYLWLSTVFTVGHETIVRFLVALAGLLTGLTTVVMLYQYICLLITLGFFILALASARWRDTRFWINVILFNLDCRAIQHLAHLPYAVPDKLHR